MLINSLLVKCVMIVCLYEIFGLNIRIMNEFVWYWWIYRNVWCKDDIFVLYRVIYLFIMLVKRIIYINRC